MPDGDSKDPLSGILLLSLAIEIRQSKFSNSFGGIAQLVERQLCKLEVRGSNPLASSLRSRRRSERRLSRPSLGEGGHPLTCSIPRASYDSASQLSCNSSMFTFCKANWTLGGFIRV